MKKFLILILILVILIIIYAILYNPSMTNEQNTDTSLTPTESSGPAEDGQTQENVLTLQSPAFENNAAIPSKYTCDADDINPALEIKNIPANAQSLALIMDDPDASAGGTWVHWLVWNIKKDTQLIVENSAPEGAVEGITSFGRTGYGGPCPPSGSHRYFFKLYVLDTTLDLATTTDKAGLEKAMAGHILAQTELMGTYSRTK